MNNFSFNIQDDGLAFLTLNHQPVNALSQEFIVSLSELFDEIYRKGFTLDSGELGENITTRGIDLVALPTKTRLLIGDAAIVELTALRNPCVQIDDFQPGLLKETLYRDDKGNPSLKRGVMGIVVVGGIIYPGDSIVINLPSKPHSHLEYVW